MENCNGFAKMYLANKIPRLKLIFDINGKQLTGLDVILPL